MRNVLAIMAVTLALPIAAPAQIVIGRSAPSGFPVPGTRCPAVESVDEVGEALSGKLQAADRDLRAARDLRLGAARDDEAALERARTSYASGLPRLNRRLLAARANERLATIRADPALLAQALATVGSGLGAEDRRLSGPARADLLAAADATRAGLLLDQAGALGGSRGEALLPEAERLFRAAAANAQARGDSEGAASLSRAADRTSLTIAIDAKAWDVAGRALDALVAGVDRAPDARQRRWARIDAAGGLVEFARSGAPVALRRVAAERTLPLLAAAEAELRDGDGRAPGLEARLDQLAGAVSGSWSVAVPQTAACSTVARIATDRALAELTLAGDAPARAAALAGLEHADAMLADVPDYRRGVLAPIALARAAAADGDRATARRWFAETERRAAHCFCTDLLAAATGERAALPRE